MLALTVSRHLDNFTLHLLSDRAVLNLDTGDGLCGGGGGGIGSLEGNLFFPRLLGDDLVFAVLAALVVGAASENADHGDSG